MANKKRRKPTNKPRQGAVRTAERPDPKAPRTDTPERGRRDGRSTAPSGRSNGRAEKKDVARRQREEVRKIIRRRERMRRAAWIGGIALVAVAGVLWIARPDGDPVATEELPGLLRTEAPWDANTEL